MSEVTAPHTGAAGPAPPQSPPQDPNTADQAKEKASEVAGQAQEKAQEAAGQAKGRARDEIDRRSTDAGQQVKTTADDLRSVGEQLRSQGKDTPAKLADQAADRAQRLGGYLEDADADRILRDVEDFARRQPLAVVAGGVVLGFAAARFLKASSSDRYQQQYG
jgi:gas vesicle protein